MVSSAVSQAWPAFALVAGLLAIGALAERDGVYAWAAARLAGSAVGRPVLATATGLLLVSVVTAFLNLDTAVAFCTPVLVLTAREAGFDERPALYGTVVMANGASLLLPGANLTTLIVLERNDTAPGSVAAELLPVGLAAAAATAVAVLVTHRAALRRPPVAAIAARAAPELGSTGRLTLALALMCAAIVILVDEPALAVLAIGLGAALARGALRLALRTISPVSLLALLTLAVGAGIVGRAWHAPSAVVGQAAPIAAAAWSAGAAVTINNLPASLLLTGRPPANPIAILIGLGLGANLAVTGSLSVLLWWRAALTVGARPSALAYSRHGAPAALLAISAALGIAALVE